MEAFPGPFIPLVLQSDMGLPLAICSKLIVAVWAWGEVCFPSDLPWGLTLPTC